MRVGDVNKTNNFTVLIIYHMVLMEKISKIPNQPCVGHLSWLTTAIHPFLPGNWSSRSILDLIRVKVLSWDLKTGQMNYLWVVSFKNGSLQLLMTFLKHRRNCLRGKSIPERSTNKATSKSLTLEPKGPSLMNKYLHIQLFEKILVANLQFVSQKAEKQWSSTRGVWEYFQ